MNQQSIRKEYGLNEGEFASYAELAGVGVRDSYDDDQKALLDFAVMLRRLRFREDRVRLCCADLTRFPETLDRELADCAGDQDRREQLEQLHTYLEDGWDGTIADAEAAVTWMEFILEGGNAAMFGTPNYIPTLLLILVAVALALIFRSSVQSLVQELWAQVMG